MALDKLGFVRKNYDLYNVSLWNTAISLRESRESSYWQFFHKSPAMCTPKLPLGNMYFTMIISMIEPPPWKKMQSLGIIIPFLWLNIKNCVNCEITNQSIWLYPQEKKNKISPCFRQTSPNSPRSHHDRISSLLGWDRHLCHSQTWCRVFHPVLATWSQHFLLVVSCEAINFRCTPSI